MTYKRPMDATTIQTKVLVEGDGAEVEDGDKVLAHIYVGNGYTKKKATAPTTRASPQQITVNSKLSPVFADALKGRTLGSRVAVTAPGRQGLRRAGNPSSRSATRTPCCSSST